MRFVLIIMLFLSQEFLFSQELSVNQIRMEFSRLSMDSCSDNGLYNRLIQTRYTANMVKLAYVGGMEAMMARCFINPLKKMAYFNAGKEKIENAIAADQENLDARFVRYQIQTNAPKILGYHENIEEDTEIIINRTLLNLQKGISVNFSRQILELFCNSPDISPKEKEMLQKKLNQY